MATKYRGQDVLVQSGRTVERVGYVLIEISSEGLSSSLEKNIYLVQQHVRENNWETDPLKRPKALVEKPLFKLNTDDFCNLAHKTHESSFAQHKNLCISWKKKWEKGKILIMDTEKTDLLNN